MADKKEDKQDQKLEAQPDEAVAKSKKKRLIIIGGLGALLVAGAAIGVFLLSSGGEKKTEHGEVMSAEDSKDAAKSAETPTTAESDEKTEGGHGEKKADAVKDDKKEGDKGKTADKDAADKKTAEAKPAASDFGETLAFKTFHLNLGNPLENNYVRLEISVEFRGGSAQKEEIEKRMPQLRDAVVNLASRKTREFLLSADGKHQLRKEILIQFNRYMSKPIDTVFITDLLIE